MNKEPDRSQRKALGKGLSALLPHRPASGPAAAAAAQAPVAPASPRPAKPALPEQFEEFQNIPLDRIRPNEEQPREAFDDASLEELSQSIRANGLIQPITVYKDDLGSFRIIAGERRWRAARKAGLAEIPALVRTVEKNRVLELALIENIQREDLNPIEIATAFHRLASDHGLSHEQIADRTGKDRSTITNFLRLLRLSQHVREQLARGALSVGHARTLLNITDPDEQARACDQIIARQLSVRDTEAFVKALTKPPEPSPENEKEKQAGPPLDPNVKAALEEMSMALGTKVRLVAKSPTAGRLEVEYYSQEDLDRIYAVIVKG
jgi:ParB family transcriptional regulator, chromosome partitioning protein